MLISCKCLNVTGHNHSVDEQVLKRAGSSQTLADVAPGTEDVQGHDGLAEFYYKYREFAKVAIGPISDIIETISQTDLAYEVPLKQFSVKYCINCKTITHLKNTQAAVSSEYWINPRLLTTPEKINALKENKQFSKVFGILLMSDSTTANKIDGAVSTSPGSTVMAMSVPTTPTTPNAPSLDPKIFQTAANRQQQQQMYIKKLTQHLDEQLQRDYNAANERISRFIEQQAAILDSNRDKAKHEYQILVSLINRVPDELKVISNSCTNNVNNNEDLINAAAAAIVKSTTSTTTPSTNTSNDQIARNLTNVRNNVIDSTQSLLSLKHQEQQHQTTTTLDTPPATPESIPMSVGNSPTFRQQTSIFGISSAISGRNSTLNSSLAGSGTVVNGDMNTNDSDCLFELDGMEYPVTIGNSNQMSDVEETEDAEDALGELEGTEIPRVSGQAKGRSVAKSLPIDISANLTISNARFNHLDDLDTELDEDHNVVDIAASIQAIAKSVHGDTIFGDLPRPRCNNKNN